MPVYYDEQYLGTGFRADLVDDDSLLLELKSVEELTDIHLAQVEIIKH